MAALTFQFEGEAMIYEPKASELLMLLRRALNTLETQKTPEWAMSLCDELETPAYVQIIVDDPVARINV
jgi:hypothetical protein